MKNRLEGIGWFTYENLKRITRKHPEHQFYFLFDRPYDNDFIFSDNVIPIVIAPQARHPFLYYIWFQYSVTRALKKIKPDLFISPDGYISLRTGIRTLNVFHDLNFEHYPEDVPFLERWYYRKYFPQFAKRANRIATVSEYSKHDIVTLKHVNPDKIDVVYNGANEAYLPLNEKEQYEIRKSVTGGLPYFYFIGSIHPRKNLINLFRAFDEFRDKSPKPVKFVVTGAKKWWTEEINTVFNNMSHKEDVIFTGRQPVEKIRGLMGAAIALTYVSYFEGFGIPIIEAFRCGTPVITANVTAMPEIAGNAALAVDPFNSSAISDAMLMIFENPQLKEQLRERGFERAEKFTWDKSAERLWASIEKLLE